MTISRPLSRALILLTALAMLAPACQRNDSGGGGDDDDATDDDDVSDDDDASSDDDDASSDDDDAAPEVPCEGASDEGPEVEPNNDGATATAFASGGSLTVTGTSDDCANDGKLWTGSADWSTNDWDSCSATATVALTWTGADDLDLLVWSTPDQGDNDVLGNFSGTDPGFDGGQVLLGGPVWFMVACWEGAGSVDWTLTVTF
jgi:hypothetical protein